MTLDGDHAEASAALGLPLQDHPGSFQGEGIEADAFQKADASRVPVEHHFEFARAGRGRREPDLQQLSRAWGKAQVSACRVPPETTAEAG